MSKKTTSSRSQLQAQCEQLGLVYKKTDSIQILQQIIKNFFARPVETAVIEHTIVAEQASDQKNEEIIPEQNKQAEILSIRTLASRFRFSDIESEFLAKKYGSNQYTIEQWKQILIADKISF
jgi:hypothetical protein